LYATVTLNY